MKKLAAVREHLLTSVLNLDAEKMHTFAEGGTITSYEGDTESFRVTYEANVVLADYAGDPTALYLIFVEWLKAHNPTSPTDALRFDVDILDEEKVDLGFQVELTEDWLVETDDDGRRLTLTPEPNHDADSLTGFTDTELG